MKDNTRRPLYELFRTYNGPTREELNDSEAEEFEEIEPIGKEIIEPYVR